MDALSNVGSDILLELGGRTADALARADVPPGDGARTGSGATTAEAARQFESYMLKLLLSEMRKTVDAGGLFDTKKSEGYVSLLDSALADRAAEAGSFGLADQLLRQWEGRS